MIIDSFDPNSEPLLNPASLYGEGECLGEVCLVPFSYQARDAALEAYPHEIANEISGTNGSTKIYRLMVGDKKILLYMSPVGSSSAAVSFTEVAWKCKCKKFVFFGSCGMLDEALCKGKVIVPKEAYRDEGTSYHYAPARDYIDMKNAPKVEEYLKGKGIASVSGRIWTCDAIYMETADKAKKRRNDGCIAVEMEAASLQAVADYYGFELYYMLFGGDVLEENSWSQNIFNTEHEKGAQLNLLEIALGFACSLA